MWIAACDDDKQFAVRLGSTLAEITAPDDCCSVYNGGLELLDAMRRSRTPVDLLLLDMEMPGLNGLETAKELRSFSRGTTVVVLSAHTKYALSCYGIRAYHYLTKPLNPGHLRSIIEEVRQNAPQGESLPVASKGQTVFVRYGDISYIESLNRSLYIHTAGNAYRSSRSISETDRDLCGKGFFRIHKSYIVNMGRVERVDKSKRTAHLFGGVTLPIGGRKQGDFLSALAKYRKTSHA